MPRFEDIPQFTRNAGYAVDVSWHYLPDHYNDAILHCQLDINPEFQRGYVWTEAQKVRYVEFILRGGMTGRDIYTNCPGWKLGQVGRNFPKGWYVLVDGKQRLDAVLGFLNNEFPIFGGNYKRDYTDRLPILGAGFRWHVNDLATYEEVLAWYCDLNKGGTVHSDEEIERVQRLKESGATYTMPPVEVIEAQANLGRQPLQDAFRKREEDDAKRKAAQAQYEQEQALTRASKKGRKR
jgi:hypothetical protein